jgi:hypothetical protein
MSAFAETLEEDWSNSDIHEADFANTIEIDMQNRQLIGHTKAPCREA